MSNKVRYGLSNLHIAFRKADGTYEIPIKVEGVVGYSPEPAGDSVEFYADNRLYYSATANNGYTADLECALIPDEILARMIGSVIDANGGLLELSNGEQAEFAILAQVDGDVRNRRFVYYSCKASRPKQEHKTTEKTKEPTTETLSVTIAPTIISGKSAVKYTLELNDTIGF